MRQLFLVVLLLIGGAALAQPGDDAKKLDGIWLVKDGTIGGKADPKVKDITAVVFKDGTMSVQTENGADEARFTLDPARMPAEINLTTARGNLSVPGIYKLEGRGDDSELIITFTQGGGGPRPKDFTGDGEKTVLLKLARKKPVRD